MLINKVPVDGGSRKELFSAPLWRDLLAYSLGSMIFADIIMFGFIVLFGLFGSWGSA